MKNRFGLLLLALVGLLAGCGGNGGRGGGTLQVDITGLPAGSPAAALVAGPAGYTQALTQSQSLVGLAAGSYVVTAGEVPGYGAQVSGSPALVEDGATRQVSVIYRAAGAGGTISGTLSIAAAADAPFVPGEVIVRLEPGLGVQALPKDVGLELVRDLPLAGVGVYRASALSAQNADAEAQTLRLVAELSARDDVVYAHPNYVLEAFATPNDPLYNAQWHYPAINLPAAWDRTTGSPGVTVAVIDSGILAEHPDLSPKLLPGYDFVSSASTSGDGDGRDGDPADPNATSRYHGSHVAGTVAAATNNGTGGAGVSWGAQLLPVRVLGLGSGTLADAIDGILWSVGEEVPGVPGNPNPADVLNLSLGGRTQCSEAPALQDALDTAGAAGAVIVVAAGNENVDANGVTPASCGGVITVGATDLSNERAGYSNYGTRIDVMAPGGDLTQDDDSNGEPDGVLSTVRDDATGDYTYSYIDGTSMAAPHVAGAIALLKSVRPSLSGAEARDVLISTARPIASCTVGCGAGLIDVAAALAELAAPATPDFSLTVSPAAVTLSTAESLEVALTLSRSGGFGDDVSFSVAGLPGGLSASFAPTSTGGDSAVLTLTAGTVAAGSYELTVQGVGGNVSKTRPLSVVVTSAETPTAGDVLGSYVFACPVAQTACTVNELPSVRIETGGSAAPYTLLNAPLGSYYVNAWKDVNANGRVDEGEPVGTYPPAQTPAPVTPPASGIDVTMYPALSTQVELFRGVRLGR